MQLFGKTIRNMFTRLREIFRPRKESVSSPVPATPVREPTERRRQTSRHPRHPERNPARTRQEQKPPRKAEWDPGTFRVPPEEGKTRFHDLGLPDEMMHAIADLQYRYCTPIQAEILPKILTGVDATGQAQTGTGKTAAFLITILTNFLRTPPRKMRPGAPRVLIMAPTRELVLQIEKEASLLAKYVKCTIVAVFGGMDYRRQKSLLTDKVVDMVVATPGRLIDFMRQKDVRLDSVEILVIDEADRMLDMGFIPDMRRIVNSTPPKSKRQTMLFSATVTPEVLRLSSNWTKDAVTVNVSPEQVSVAAIDQKVYITTTDEKFTVLYNCIEMQHLERVIIFANRRDEARRLFEKLTSLGIHGGLLSGEVTQRERIRTLEALRSGAIRVLVATDVAARGLHIEGVSHVINYNLPLDPEDYVHRIGRTGRAGAEGISVSFACEEDGPQIPLIEQFIGRPLTCVYPEEEWLTPPPPPSATPPKIHSSSQKRFGPPRQGRRGPPRRRGREGGRR
ncbi:MAG: DEAD/DEAH box helicase [Ignavibacteria bacterium]|nr:DEAD/DEAH box helicase [Ignavibacteria bacterium]